MMLWKKFDCLTDSRVHLDCNDQCFYARDFISGGGFGASDDNNLISNFKKDVSRRGLPEWRYKEKAIRQFATDLMSILPQTAIVAAIPTSKSRDDDGYDSRLDDTLDLVVRQNRMVRVERPIERTETVQAVHHGGSRSISDVSRTLRWVGFDEETTQIILIDDVITCGSHFKACQRLLRQHNPYITVYGVFWARTVWQN